MKLGHASHRCNVVSRYFRGCAVGVSNWPWIATWRSTTKVEQHVQRNCKLFAKAKARHWKGKSEDGRKSSPSLHSKFAGCALEPCRRRDCIALGQALTRTMISENFAGKRSVSDHETAEICRNLQHIIAIAVIAYMHANAYSGH